MKSSFFLLILHLISIISFSQDLNYSFKDKPLFLFNSNTNEFNLIADDSIIYNLKNKTKTKLLNKTNVPSILNEYKYLNIQDKTYLIHNGCGPVFEFRNDSIVRIDNSFLHLNQLSAVVFNYNNEIYFQGGYGLFTYKNILTKFDFTSKEWVLVKTKGIAPIPLSHSQHFLKNNKLYVFAGEGNEGFKNSTRF